MDMLWMTDGRRMSTRRASQLIPMSSPPNLVAGSSSQQQAPVRSRTLNHSSPFVILHVIENPPLTF